MSLVIINENDDYYIKLAKRYCNFSNAHDLELIREMIHKDATIYGHHGVDDIMEGIKIFRVQHQNVSWIFHRFNLIGKVDHDDHAINNNKDEQLVRVSFNFDRHWYNKNEERFKCTATEYIDFTSDGLMMSIGYIDGPSEPIHIQAAEGTVPGLEALGQEAQTELKNHSSTTKKYSINSSHPPNISTNQRRRNQSLTFF